MLLTFLGLNPEFLFPIHFPLCISACIGRFHCLSDQFTCIFSLDPLQHIPFPDVSVVICMVAIQSHRQKFYETQSSSWVMKNSHVVSCLLHVPATCWCISGTDLLPPAATLRYKWQIKLSISSSHSTLTPGQPAPALTLQCQASGRVATGVPIFKSLV